MKLQRMKQIAIGLAIMIPILSFADVKECGAPESPGFCQCFVPQLIENCKERSPVPSACQDQDTIRQFMLRFYGNNPQNICASNPMPGVSQEKCVADLTFFLAEPYATHCG